MALHVNAMFRRLANWEGVGLGEVVAAIAMVGAEKCWAALISPQEVTGLL